MFTTINPYGLDIENVAWQVSTTAAEGGLYDVIPWGAQKPHQASIRTYNFLHGGKDLYICKPEGIITKVPTLPDEIVASYGPSSQYWNDTLRQIRKKGGVLIEFNSHLREDLQECREYQFYQYSDICKKDIRKAIMDGMHSNYTYFVFISQESLKSSSTGVYVPWCGYTMSIYASSISNKHLTLTGLTGSDNSGYAGIRFRCMAPAGKASFLYARINDQVIRIAPEDYAENDRLGVDVFITEGHTEHYIGRVELPEALEGRYLESQGRKIWVKLYETEMDALHEERAQQRKIADLEEEIASLKRQIKTAEQKSKVLTDEAKIKESEIKQGFFGKTLNFLNSVIGPAIKFAAFIAPLVAGYFAASA